MTTNVTICGDGNGAHTLAGIASMNEELSVTLLSVREHKSETWNWRLAVKGFKVNLPNGHTIEQLPGNVKFKVTSNVSAAIESAEVVIFVCPAYAHAFYFELIVEHLSDTALVIGMPGHPGFDYQCLYYLRKCGKRCSLMSLATLPWVCRIIEYGHHVSVLSFKEYVKTSVIHQYEQEKSSPHDLLVLAQKILGSVPVLRKANSGLELVLMAIVHPCIMYSKWKNWGGDELSYKPLFYQGVDHQAATDLDTACNELVAVADKVKQFYPQLRDIKVGTIHQWLLDHYSDQITDKTTLLTTLKTNKAYDGLVHPMTQTSSGKFKPDFSYRYMTEDVPYGIVVQRAIAEMVGVATPMIDRIITWAQEILGVEYLVDGRINTELKSNTRIPQMYGFNSIEDVLNFSSN